eukprot:TRINITY_DN13029_c0_g2_i1.p1 TRINITY_DN13029_c0_g2~~TRINITY_DN13029_c0_g2_i1.p1  ORF type:complete len:1230 (+),score=269.16 TRINITY_DN13029_c0_g2_i1:178-3867(+)
MYATAFCAALFALMFGAAMVTQFDDWAYSTDVLVPVLVPGKDERTGTQSDFNVRMNSDNLPYLCLIASVILVIFWGVTATICPDVAELFGDDQMAVGVGAICLSIMFGVSYPLYKKLRLNYVLHSHYRYIVGKPNIGTPVEELERICFQQYQTKVLEPYVEQGGQVTKGFLGCGNTTVPMDQTQLFELATVCFNQAFSNAFRMNQSKGPSSYRSAHHYNKKGENTVFDTVVFADAVSSMFGIDSEPSFTFNQFMIFFKRHCLRLCMLEYDHSFLKDKRDTSLRELQSFRMQVTAEPAELHNYIDGSALTAPRLSRKLRDELYPQAFATIKPCPLVWCWLRSYSGEVDYSNRREYWSRLYEHEDHKVHLLLEKMRFEGHFALSTIAGASIAGSLDQVAFFAVRAGFKEEDTNEYAGAVGETDEIRHHSQAELPIPGFKHPLALTLLKAQSRDTAMQVGKEDVFLEGDARRSDSYNVAKELALVTAGITAMHESLEFLAKYIALPSMPADLGDCDHADPADNSISFISASDWVEIFGMLGSEQGGIEPSGTVVDLYNKIDALKTAWLKLMDPDCYKRMKAPLVYASALLLEFYDTDLLVSWFASSGVRYARYCESRESSIGFRVFTNNMIKTASDAGIKVGDQRAFTQMIQTVQSMLEGLEGACQALFADEAQPDFGPAVLREAYYQIKAEAVYELVFYALAGDTSQARTTNRSVPVNKVQEWARRLRDGDPETWSFERTGESRLAFFDKYEGSIPMDEFVTAHLKACGSGPDRRGNVAELAANTLCAKGTQWYLFDELLEQIKEDYVKANGLFIENNFVLKLEATTAGSVLKPLSRLLNTVDTAFDGCFYFDQTSYLRHFKHSTDAIQPPKTEQQMLESRDLVFSKLQEPGMSDLIQKYCYKQHKYLNHLVSLLEADSEVRNDYAAMHRTLRTLNMSRMDGNLRNGGLVSEQANKQRVTQLLGGALGCDRAEELLIKRATQIIHPPQPADIEVEPKRMAVKLFFQNSAAVQAYKRTFNQMNQSMHPDSDEGKTVTPNPLQVTAPGKGSGNGVDEALVDEYQAPPYEVITLFLLDNLLVGTAQMEVDFAGREAIFQLARESADDNMKISMGTAEGTLADDLEYSNQSSISLTVVRTGMMLPLLLFNEISVEDEDLPVVQVTGERLRGGDKMRETIYLSAFTMEEHLSLMRVLTSQSRTELSESEYRSLFEATATADEHLPTMGKSAVVLDV